MLPDKKELKLNHSTTSNPAAHKSIFKIEDNPAMSFVPP